MKRNVTEIREEIQKRGGDVTSTQDVVLWGILFSLEDLCEGLKN